MNVLNFIPSRLTPPCSISLLPSLIDFTNPLSKRNLGKETGSPIFSRISSMSDGISFFEKQSQSAKGHPLQSIRCSNILRLFLQAFFYTHRVKRTALHFAFHLFNFFFRKSVQRR